MSVIWQMTTSIVDAATEVLKLVLGFAMHVMLWLGELLAHGAMDQYTHSNATGRGLWILFLFLLITFVIAVCIRTFYIPVIIFAAIPILYFLAKVFVIGLFVFTSLILYHLIKYKISDLFSYCHRVVKGWAK